MGNCCGAKCVRIGALVLNMLSFVFAAWLLGLGEHKDTSGGVFCGRCSYGDDNTGWNDYDDDDDDDDDDDVFFGDGNPSRSSGGWALICGFVCTILSTLLGILTLCNCCCCCNSSAGADDSARGTLERDVDWGSGKTTSSSTGNFGISNSEPGQQERGAGGGAVSSSVIDFFTVPFAS